MFKPKNKVDEFDNLNCKKIDELAINSALSSFLSNNDQNLPYESLAELIAFEFTEDYTHKKSGWGTYFGPMSVVSRENENVFERPSIKLVTPEILIYWESRARESVNPLLIARYSGLVYDFSRKITNTKPSYEITQIYINSLIDVANGDYSHPINVYKKLKRALFLSINLNFVDLIEKTKKTIISYENKHSEDDKPGLWGYAFDLLVNNKKVNLTQDEEINIITELENKLNRITKDSKNNIWAAENAVEKLVLYYNRKQKKDDTKRIIYSFSNAIEATIDNTKEAMMIAHLLEKQYYFFSKYNLKTEAQEILIRLRTLGPQLHDSLKPIPFRFSIPTKLLEQFSKSLLKGTSQEVLTKIAVYFLPNKNTEKEKLFTRSKKSPFQYIVTQQIQDSKGRIVAEIAPIEEDLEGHLAQSISKNIQLNFLFLETVLKKGISSKKINKTDIINFIKKASIIENDRFIIIEKAIDAYLINDHIIFIHLVIPQIEEAIRFVVEETGNVVLKPKNNGYKLKTFDELLREESIENMCENIANYFRIIFTDQRGWNLRNTVCHGMSDRKSFNQITSDRVLHALLCLGLIRLTTK